AARGSRRNCWGFSHPVAGVAGVSGSRRPLRAPIAIRIRFRRVKLKSRIPVPCPNKCFGSIRREGQFGQLSGAVRPAAASRKALQGKLQLLCSYWDADIEAHSAASPGLVKCSERAGSCGPIYRTEYTRRRGWRESVILVRAYYTAGVNAVAESANNAIHLVMTIARIYRGVDEEVRRLVDRISRGINKVEQSSS